MSRKTIREMAQQPALECLAPESHDELVINLPLPPRTLSPNGEEGTSKAAMFARARAKEEYRETCTAIVLSTVQQHGWRPPQRARLRLHFGYRRNRIIEQALPKSRKYYRADDPDNAVASAKMAIDALRHGQAIVDDSWKHIELGAVTVNDDEGPYLQISVMRLA